jgi:arabinose-5-phosphate isomerase
MLNDEILRYMLRVDEIPIISENALLKDALELMSKFKVGIVVVVDEENTAKSVFTDGDFRRLILTNQQPLAALLVNDISKFANKNYLSIESESNVQKAIEILEKNKILDCPVISKGKIVGLFHTRSILKLLNYNAVS